MSQLAISGTQAVGLYLGLPALLFGVVALVAYLTSRPSGGADGAFPRLRPGQAPVNNSGQHAGRPQPAPAAPPVDQTRSVAVSPDQPPQGP